MHKEKAFIHIVFISVLQDEVNFGQWPRIRKHGIAREHHWRVLLDERCSSVVEGPFSQVIPTALVRVVVKLIVIISRIVTTSHN